MSAGKSRIVERLAGLCGRWAGLGSRRICVGAEASYRFANSVGRDVGAAGAVKIMGIRRIAVDRETDHNSRWMTKFDVKSPMELIAEIPPIEINGRVFACEGGKDRALGHPVEFICLDGLEPAVCKYCGLRYVSRHHH